MTTIIIITRIIIIIIIIIIPWELLPPQEQWQWQGNYSSSAGLTSLVYQWVWMRK